MLDVAVVAVLFAVLSPYLIGPILIRLTQRWPARPAFEPYDPILHPLPDDLAVSFRQSVDALIRSGLRSIADAAHASNMSKVQVRVALLADAAGEEHALVLCGRSTNPKVKLAACHVEFPTKFADGGGLTVNNSTQPDTYAPAPGRFLEVKGRAVLVCTGWDTHWRTDTYSGGEHPFLTRDAAEHLAAAGAALVGIDSLNIDDDKDGTRPAHSILLRAGIAIVEHLTNLGALPAAGFRFFAVPPRIKGMGSFPVRAFAAVSSPARAPRG